MPYSVLGIATRDINVKSGDLLGFKEGSVVAVPFFENLKFVVGQKRSGGMGSVYQLIPIMPNMPVLALKTYQGTQNFRQFSEEARIWISLGTHPNIAKAISFGEMSGAHCIMAMWYSGDMNSVDSKLMSYEEVRVFISGIIDGLEYAHNMNRLIHKDIKPANILIGNDKAPRIADFGISTALSPSDMDISTYKNTRDLVGNRAGKARHEICGTPYYMAPELFSGEINSVKTDIFALGITLFDWLTGEHPYHSKVGAFDPDRVSVLLRSVGNRYGKCSEPLVNMMRQAIHLDPKLRPSSYAELRDRSKFVAGRPHGAGNKQAPGNRKASDIVSTAQVLRRQGRTDEALKVLRDAVRSSPEDAMLLSAYATSLIRIGQSAIARPFLEKAVRSNVENGNTYSGAAFIEPNINLSLLYIEDRRFNDAESLLVDTSTSIKNEPLEFESLYWEFAWLSLFQGNIDESRRRVLLHVEHHAPNMYVLAISCLIAFLAPDKNEFLQRLFKKISSYKCRSSIDGVYLKIIGSQLGHEYLRHIETTMIDDECAKRIRALGKKMLEQEMAFDGPIGNGITVAILRDVDNKLTGGKYCELL